MKDVSSIERTILVDCYTPWSVTYATSVAYHMMPLNFHFDSLAFVAWSELAGFVLCKKQNEPIQSFSLSREYLSFGTNREQSAHEAKENGMISYEFCSSLKGSKLVLVKPIRQPYDTTSESIKDDGRDGSILELAKVDEIGEIVMSAAGLDHQSVISLESVGDKLFKCQLGYKQEALFGKESEWDVPWVRTGILACVARSGKLR